MAIRLIQAPYDSAHREQRMGAGRARIASGWHDSHRFAAGAGAAAPKGRAREEPVIIETTGWSSEIGTAFALNRKLADAVPDTLLQCELPLVLAGNCITALGTVAAVTAATAPDSERQRQNQRGSARPREAERAVDAARTANIRLYL